MTVAELIAELQKCAGDRTVWIIDDDTDEPLQVLGVDAADEIDGKPVVVLRTEGYADASLRSIVAEYPDYYGPGGPGEPKP